jgi:ribosomal protein L16 Arg81 hydroxylase
VPQEWSSWGAAQRAQPMRLWVSVRGSVSPLHFDAAGSFLCQLRGRKRTILFPPQASLALYPYPIGHPLYRRSRVDLYEEHAQRDRWFPRFGAGVALAREVWLEEGDVLLIPPLWWHHVETVSSLSVSVGARYV